MQKHKIDKIGILTSGGDAPGMNAAIRAIVRAADYHGIQATGFVKGYSGLVQNEFVTLDNRSVSNIIQQGGTILRSARCKAFRTEEGQRQAADSLRRNEIDALFIIGGDGSLKGAHTLSTHWSGQIIGLPGTIDNDLSGTDYTIGYFTALDTALDAIDKIRDTADSIERVFLIEVMGRMAGFIAAGAGVAGGAEEILVPEKAVDIDALAADIALAKEQGKVSFIIIVAEGAYPGGATTLSAELQKRSGIECRPCILGYIQRGGSPAALDRIVATKLGAFSVEQALQGASGVMAGIIKNKLVTTPLKQTWENKKPLDPYLFELQRIMAR